MRKQKVCSEKSKSTENIEKHQKTKFRTHSKQINLIIFHLPILDVMVLNDIIEQAAGRHSRASDHGGEVSYTLTFQCF